MITPNDFDRGERLTLEAKTREEGLLELEIKELKLEGKKPKQIRNFLSNQGEHYIALCEESRKVEPLVDYDLN